MRDMEGRNYQILNTIATGGTAVLYKAIQTSLDREVVIKKLHAHLTSDSNFTGRFTLEAKAAASLDHENIVRIIDSGATGNNYYIVMEYIDGVTIKDLLEKYGTLSDELTLIIAREICLGLDHAHQRGIIHRDIKPANIMITCEGQVKITDFGLAKLHDSQIQQTVASTLLGTPLYMSPEQAIGEGIDGRSDIFSLGTVCYEMMTGKQPFRGDNYAAVIQKIISGVLPSPSRIVKTIDPGAESLVMKALSREPGKRYRSALEMAHAIESLLDQEKILAVRHNLRRLVAGNRIIQPAAKKTSGKKRRRRLLPLMLAASIVLASGIYLILNPERIRLVRSRIDALLAPDPACPADNPVLAAGSELNGTGIFINLPEDQPAEGIIPAADTLSAPAAGPDSLYGGILETSSTPAAESVPEQVPEKDPPPQTTGREAAAQAQPVSREPEIPMGLIDIQVEPEAEIIIDGVHRLSANRYGPVEITAGRHQITCRQIDFRDYAETIVIQKGELSRRRIQLAQLTGSIEFQMEEGIRVIIDGIYKGTTPFPAPLTLTTGKHLVDLKKSGYRDWSNKVFISADETMNLKINLVPN
ncbi:MAG: protein kinase [Candidatus Krumholzibacteriota bacterium]|nr:protein kinase [Candidatus Krumholzibacteriota bacterium]